MAELILLIACHDVKGLVAKVTGLLFDRDCNITENGEFVDLTTRRFYMRTAFSGPVEQGDLLEEVRAILPADADVRLLKKRKKRIAVLATREAHCLGDLLIRCAYDDLAAEIVSVVANHDLLRPLVEPFGVRFSWVSHEGLDRAAHEARLTEELEAAPFDFIVMAKFMRILSSSFTGRYRGRLLNIHHSFLPAFIGANPYRQAYERGVKVIGATAHFATEALDEGPIIAQGTLPVDHTLDASSMARAGRDVEKTVLAQALHLICEDRVFVTGNKTVILR